MTNLAATKAGRLTYVERVNRAIDLMLSRPDEPPRLERLARVAGLSPFHFHRVFQAMVGETPADFSKRVRLERALGIMAFGGRRTLTDIALACGFGSSSDFSRAFKQRYGVPPRVFDVEAWRAAHGEQIPGLAAARVERPPGRENPDGFRVRIRDLPVRWVAYIRVARPYQGDGVVRAAERLVDWAERRRWAGGQWLGYQWENPEITRLEDCRYCVGVEVPGGREAPFAPRGEVGLYRFDPMTVAEVPMDGPIEMEIRLLTWLYGSWLPRSGYVPADQPCFEVWRGRPFAHGTERFTLAAHLPLRPRRARA